MTNLIMSTPVLPNRYKSIKKLGEGLSAEVFLVKDSVLKKELALKLFKKGKKTSSAEFKTLIRLNHPNIVKVHDFGLVEGGQSYFTEDYVEGSDLISAAGKWGDDKKLNATKELADALYYLHQNGVRHGDIKPSNIIVTKDGAVELLDFGLSRIVGGLAGTPAYISPEQADGKVPDIRADLYSLGVVLLELFTGKNPFLGKSVAETLKRQRGLSAPLTLTLSPGGRGDNKRLPLPLGERAGVRGTIENIISKLLEKNPDARLQGADEILLLLSARPSEVGAKTMHDPVADEAVASITSGEGIVIAGLAESTDEQYAAREAFASAQVAGKNVIKWSAASNTNLLNIIFSASLRAGRSPRLDDKWQIFEEGLNCLKRSSPMGCLLIIEDGEALNHYTLDFLRFVKNAEVKDISIAILYLISEIHKTPLAAFIHDIGTGAMVVKSKKPPPMHREIRRIEAEFTGEERVRYFKEAAANSMALYDFEGAVSYLQRALKEKKNAELLEMLSDAALKNADYKLLLKTLDELKKGDFKTKIKRATALAALGKAEEARVILHSVKPKNDQQFAYLKDREFRMLLKQGRYDEIVKEGAEANDAVLLNTIGLAHYYLGRFDEARGFFKRSLKAKGRDSVKGSSFNYLGMAAYNQGEFEEAKANYGKALKLFQKLSHPMGKMSSLINMAAVFHSLGEYREAMRYYNDAVQISKLTGETHIEASLHNNMANLFIATTLYDEAERELLHARRLASNHKYSIIDAYNDLIEADLLMVKGDEKKARALIEGAIKKFKSQNSIRETALALINLAKTYKDDLKAAKQFFDEAEELAKRHNLTNELDMILIERVVCHREEPKGRRGDPLNASDHRRLLRRFTPHNDCRNSLGKAGGNDINRLPKEMRWEAHAILGEYEKAAEIITWLSSQVPLEARERFLKEKRRAEVLARVAGSKKGDDMELNSLKRLLEINKKMTAELSTERVLTFIMDSVIELTGAERGFLLLKTKNEFNIPVARNVDAEDIKKPKFKVSRSIAERVIRRGEPLFTTDASADARFKASESVHIMKLRSVLSVPMRYRAETLGAIYVDNRYQAGLFDDNDLDVLTAFADQAAIAYINAKFYEEKEKANREVAELNKKLESMVARQSVEIEEMGETLALKQKDLELKYQYKNIIGKSAAMQAVFQMLDRVTDTESNVLITGESGTGKELVARAIHYNGSRKERPFVSVNCAAIPAALLESELFGHKKGSFTGAVSDKMGLFEQANFGTIFLDEIGDMPLDMQAKLLRAIQEGEIRRVGSNQHIKVNIRLIAATNKNLGDMVAQKRFRDDLFYRLNVLPVRLPPLRERREDIPLLIDSFLEKYARGKPKKEMEQGARRALINYRWPGNVRELENEIERATIMADEKIGAADLSDNVKGCEYVAQDFSPANIGRSKDLCYIDGKTGLKEAKAGVERQMILEAIDKCTGNKSKAAKLLGLSRYGLYKKMERYGM